MGFYLIQKMNMETIGGRPKSTSTNTNNHQGIDTAKISKKLSHYLSNFSASKNETGKTYEVDPDSGFEIIPEEDVFDEDAPMDTTQNNPDPKKAAADEREKYDKMLEEATKPITPNYA